MQVKDEEVKQLIGGTLVEKEQLVEDLNELDLDVEDEED